MNQPDAYLLSGRGYPFPQLTPASPDQIERWGLVSQPLRLGGEWGKALGAQVAENNRMKREFRSVQNERDRYQEALRRILDVELPGGSGQEMEEVRSIAKTALASPQTSKAKFGRPGNMNIQPASKDA